MLFKVGFVSWWGGSARVRSGVYISSREAVEVLYQRDGILNTNLDINAESKAETDRNESSGQKLIEMRVLLLQHGCKFSKQG
jgi:hypothetical protein